MRRFLAAALLASLVVVPTAFATSPPKAKASYSGGSFAGEGFDKCEAPSSSALRSWLASPYRAVNIYMGGSNRACADQPELTTQWLSTVTQNGWSIIPTYVGSQAGCTTSSKNDKIVPSTAAAQGTSEADDAAAGMAALGLAPGANNPVYFDMEPYHIGSSYQACDNAVLTFLAAWTTELHVKGYLSGVYGTTGSTNGVIYALTQKQSDPTYQQPDAIWYAHWYSSTDTTHDSTTDESFLGSYWTGHRIHQWVGGHNETYNGVTNNIDSDRVDGDVVAAVAPTPPPSPAPYHYAAAPPYSFTSQSFTTLKERSAPSTSAPQTATYPYGADLAIVCQTTGDAVQGDSVWDQLSDGNYVSDIFTTTTGGLSVTNGIPACGSTPPPDTTPPTATMNALPAVTLDATQAVSWSGTDDSSGVASYDVQWERARWNGGFGGWQQPARWTGTTATSGSLSVWPGVEYCLHVRATDVAGNVGAWSAPVCVARPLDDRRLAATRAWTRQTGSPFYLQTITATKARGVQLELPGVQARQVGVVVTVCASCGSVRVLLGNQVVGAVNLRQNTFRNRRVFWLPAFSMRTRTVRLVTASAGLVRIDGLVVRRR